MENKSFETVASVEEYMTDIIARTPIEQDLSADSLARSVSAMLDLQYGKDRSNVRSIFALKQLRQSASAHLRRAYDSPDDEGNQLTFSEWGKDIQDRYPVISGGERVYSSPLSAPVDQLEAWADKHKKRGETILRRVVALRGFIKKHR